MSRRFFAIILIIGGALAIVGVILWLRNSSPVKAPLPRGVIPTPIVQEPSRKTPEISKPTPAKNLTEINSQAKIKQFAMDTVSRMASYSNADNFAGISSVMTRVSPEVKSFLETEQQKLRGIHPLRDGSWAQSTRSLASHIISTLPIGTQTAVEVLVETQQTIEYKDKAQEVSYQQYVLSLQKQENDWIVTKITWKPIEP